MSVKDILNRASSVEKTRLELKNDAEATLKVVKADHLAVNEKIQQYNNIKNKAESDVKSCIANLYSNGLSREAFPKLDAAREELDRALKENDTAELEKISESLQNDIAALDEVIKRAK